MKKVAKDYQLPHSVLHLRKADEALKDDITKVYGCSKPTGQPAGKLKEAIAAEYGSLDNFKKLFKQACFHVLGCGWVWLNAEKAGNIHIQITKDNQPPSMESVTPLLGIDVWEHAYFLRYPAQLGAYVDGWFERVSWTAAENRYESCLTH